MNRWIWLLMFLFCVGGAVTYFILSPKSEKAPSTTSSKASESEEDSESKSADLDVAGEDLSREHLDSMPKQQRESYSPPAPTNPYPSKTPSYDPPTFDPPSNLPPTPPPYPESDTFNPPAFESGNMEDDYPPGVPPIPPPPPNFDEDDE